jgi:hypothetical protein
MSNRPETNSHLESVQNGFNILALAIRGVTYMVSLHFSTPLSLLLSYGLWTISNQAEFRRSDAQFTCVGCLPTGIANQGGASMSSGISTSLGHPGILPTSEGGVCVRY